MDTSLTSTISLSGKFEEVSTRGHHVTSISEANVKAYIGSDLYFDDTFQVGDLSHDNYHSLNGAIYYFPESNPRITYTSGTAPYTYNKSYISASYSLPKDPYSQEDIMFAYTSSSLPHVDLDFKHALSSVQVKYDLRKQTRTISSIKVTDTYTDGHFTFDGSNFVWYPDVKGTIDFKFTKECPEGSTEMEVTSNSTNSLIFLIPLGNPKFTITFTDGDVVSATLHDMSTLELTAGVNYIIDLRDEGQPSIDIDDTVDELTKSNAVVSNTSKNPGYIRCVMTANFVDKDGNIISPCTLNLQLNEGWYYSNGFYYYSKKLYGGESTPAIFKPYTVTLPANAVSCKWDILAQVQEEPW